jgi:hypothetical protein
MEDDQEPRRPEQQSIRAHRWQAAEMMLRLASIVVELGVRHLGW